MEMNENLVTEVTENVEQTTEETVEQVETPAKTYTEEEVNRIVGKRLARQEAKIRKENEEKYGRLERVLEAGTGKKGVGELIDTFENYYLSKGIQIPEGARYSDRDIETLANKDADDIIEAGYEDVVEEVDRLANLGTKMSAREKAMFKKLAEYRQNAERGQELSKIGVKKEVYESKEFKDFASKFNSTTPITEIYDFYTKQTPKKNIKPMGSMKNNTSADSGIKDFYSVEEARKFTQKDFDKNPELYKRVVESSYKW